MIDQVQFATIMTQLLRVPPTDLLRVLRRGRTSPRAVATAAQLKWALQDGLFSDNVKSFRQVQDYANALDWIPPHMVRWVQQTNEFIAIVSPEVIQYASHVGMTLPGTDDYSEVERDVAGGITMMFPRKERTVILVPPTNFVHALDYEPGFLLCHELGHHFQWFTRPDEWETLDQYRTYAQLEWYADLFGYFFTNSPPGIRRKHRWGLYMDEALSNVDLARLNSVFMRIYNAARNSVSYDEFLLQVGD